MMRQSIRPANLPFNLPPPKLRLALGLTCQSVNSLAVDPHTGTLAYPASGVIILFDIVKNRQVQYVSCARTAVSFVSFSPDGNVLLIGESGRLPALRVWSITQKRSLAAFRDHCNGLVCAQFSQAMDLIVSVGTKHDQQICVRAWPKQTFLSTNRFWEGVCSMSACPTSPTFVTCGEKHVKFWYPDAQDKSPGTSTLLGRPATLGSLKNQSFVACAWGSGRSEGFVFAVTSAGHICKISADLRSVRKTRQLKDAHMTSVQVTGNDLYVGTVRGYITLLDVDTLETKMSLTSPLDICFAEQAMRGGDPLVSSVVDEHSAHVYLTLDPTHQLLVAALTNGSLCVWDVRDHGDVKKTHYSVSHSKAITCLESMTPLAPVNPEVTTPDVTPLTPGQEAETLVTVAHDSTVRLWQMVMGRSVCCESSKTIYTDLNRTPEEEAPESPDLEIKVEGVKDDGKEVSRMITTAKVSPQGDVIVTGDSRGLLTVYDAASLANIDVLQHHSRDVTAIAFFSHAEPNVMLMLTAAKDRLINMFAADGKLRLLKTLLLHSGCVTSLGVCFNHDKFILVSASHDRSVILSTSPWRRVPQFKPAICQTGSSPVVDIVLNQTEHQVIVARLTGEVNVFDVSQLTEGQKKLTNSIRFKACTGENVHLEKITLDPRGRVLLAASSDHVISVLSHPTGVLLTSVHGHSKGVTGLRFSHSLRYIVSTAADGCVFVWTMPTKVWTISAKIKKVYKLKQQRKLMPQPMAIKDELVEVSLKDGRGERKERGVAKHTAVDATVGPHAGVNGSVEITKVTRSQVVTRIRRQRKQRESEEKPEMYTVTPESHKLKVDHPDKALTEKGNTGNGTFSKETSHFTEISPDVTQNKRVNFDMGSTNDLAEFRSRKCQNFVNTLEDPVGALTDDEYTLNPTPSADTFSSNVSLDFGYLHAPDMGEWEETPLICPSGLQQPRIQQSFSPLSLEGDYHRHQAYSPSTISPLFLEDADFLVSREPDIKITNTREKLPNVTLQSTMNPYAKEWSANTAKKSSKALNPYAKEWTGMPTKKSENQWQSKASQPTFSEWLSCESTWQDNAQQPTVGDWPAQDPASVRDWLCDDVKPSRDHAINDVKDPSMEEWHFVEPPTQADGWMVEDTPQAAAGAWHSATTPTYTNTPTDTETPQLNEELQSLPPRTRDRVQYFENKWQESKARVPTSSGYSAHGCESASRSNSISDAAMKQSVDRLLDSEKTDTGSSDETHEVNTTVDESVDRASERVFRDTDQALESTRQAQSKASNQPVKESGSSEIDDSHTCTVSTNDEPTLMEDKEQSICSMQVNSSSSQKETQGIKVVDSPIDNTHTCRDLVGKNNIPSSQVQSEDTIAQDNGKLSTELAAQSLDTRKCLGKKRGVKNREPTPPDVFEYKDNLSCDISSNERRDTPSEIMSTEPGKETCMADSITDVKDARNEVGDSKGSSGENKTRIHLMQGDC